MKLEACRLHVLRMPLKSPFKTSFGVERDRRFILVEALTDEGPGYAEVVAMEDPLYNEEWVKGSLLILQDYLIPALKGMEFSHPDEIYPQLDFIRRHYMAKSGLESALWEAWSRSQGLPLWKALGGEKKPIPVGVSVGIQPSPEALVEVVSRYVEEGYRRIKLKIEPGHDLEFVAAVRKALPQVPLMVDANSAYCLADVEHLKKLDEFDLMMIEQPLSYDDIIWHARLQKELKTPICLDESIHSAEDAEKAFSLDACRIINIKVGRVGGLSRAKALQQVSLDAGIPVWCGGMLESGVGRAHNMAITSLPGFTLPGDTSGSDRYWAEDIVSPEIRLQPGGTLELSDRPGMGYQILWDRVEKFREELVEV
ncbi:MAG: o-succinylbenzoate synthase [Bacillota bacterium]|nr:o-succinylbenzoate synthase [Bacillota bacterium]